jgi:hypothetical protein
MLPSTFPELPAHLAIFEPINRRKRHEEAKFQMLRHHYPFSPMQKDWFAQQVLKEFDKTGGIDYIGKLSQTKFIDRYKIASATARTWIEKYKDPKKINHGPHGQQAKLADDKFLQMAMEEVAAGTVVTTGKGKGNKDKHMRMTELEVKACLSKHHQLMLKSQGKRAHEDEGWWPERSCPPEYARS